MGLQAPWSYWTPRQGPMQNIRKLKTENSVSMNRKKRRLQKLKQMRADKEHTERINLQQRYDALEDQVGTKVKMEDDSDIAVGENRSLDRAIQLLHSQA